MATKDIQSDPTSVEINGVVYSLKEAPSPDSSIVQREKERLERVLIKQDLVSNLESIADYIRLANYAVAGTTLEADTHQLLTNIVTTLQLSYSELDDIARTALLDTFVDGINFLLLGGEDLAFKRLTSALKGIEGYVKPAAKMMDLLKDLGSSCREQLHAAYIVDAKDAAISALRQLQTDIRLCTEFWEMMGEVLCNLKRCDVVDRYLEGMKGKDKETEQRFVLSKASKHELMMYYAKWVALQQSCSTSSAGVKSAQDKLLTSLLDRPSVEEARRKLPKMLQEAWEKH